MGERDSWFRGTRRSGPLTSYVPSNSGRSPFFTRLPCSLRPSSNSISLSAVPNVTGSFFRGSEPDVKNQRKPTYVALSNVYAELNSSWKSVCPPSANVCARRFLTWLFPNLRFVLAVGFNKNEWSIEPCLLFIVNRLQNSCAVVSTRWVDSGRSPLYTDHAAKQ